MNIGKALGYAAIFIMFSSQAYAHAVFNEMKADAGAFHTAQLRITHGCDGSPTNTVTIQIPDGVWRVTPRMVPGWTIRLIKRDLPAPVKLHGETYTDTVDTITWSGGNLPDFAYEQFEIRMMMPQTPGKRLDFITYQKCDVGEIWWNEIPKNRQSPWELERPTPFIKLKSASMHDHGR